MTKRRFLSAKDAVSAIHYKEETSQTLSPSFRLAFTDQEFLLADPLRPVRLQLELMKPELLLQQNEVESTIIVFGSARTKSKEEAEVIYKDAQEQQKQNPNDRGAKLALKRAKKTLEHSEYYEQARKFATLVKNHGLNEYGYDHVLLTTGGGPGIMEAANRGAQEAGERSIGLTIALPKEERPNPYVTPELCFKFHYFAIRKMHFLMRAIALVAFPGGFGTFDELFETLTLMQTRRSSRMPIVLFGTKFWNKVVNFEALVDEGVIAEEDLDLYVKVDKAEDAWEAIKNFYKAEHDAT